LGLTTRGGAAR